MTLRVNVVGAAGLGTRVLMLIHGYGADEHDLAGLTPALDPEGRFFTVCPRGPLDVEPYGGASWYHFTDHGPDPATFQGSLIELDHLLDAVCEHRGAQRSEVVVAGFSQGGSMALALALRRSGKARPAAALCLSGFLHQPDWLEYDWRAPDLPPVWVQHGTHDPMLPAERGRRSASTLEQHGVDVTYREYPMQHEIRPECITDLRSWLRQRIGG
ncbi:MAG: alpha/beta hydrolase [Acidimicrobiales bacterium]